MQNLDRKNVMWLILGLAVWVVTVPLLSGVMESPAIALGVMLVWLLFPLLYTFVARDKEGIGLTRKNMRRAVAEMLLVTAVYSLIRIGLILFVPASVDYIAASAIQVAGLLKAGQFGSLAGPPTLLFPLMFILTFLAAAGNELFYRGFLFTRIRQRTHWLVALLASAALFGFYHYFNS
ncbi:MAG: CPBP family intramembrane metalloprotease, partial [Chloroflexi bacterium]|nr:CPBP family intramembrane metalloprotease [Chloroflexota bacterium]